MLWKESPGSATVHAAQPPMPASPGIAALALPELDPLFRQAERLDHESAWFGHVPFAQWLVRAAQPRLLVELGTHSGISYAAFCRAVEAEGLATRCYAVDTWQGDAHVGGLPEAVFADLDRYNQARFGGFSQLLRATFDDAAEKFADGSIDLLHIDGLHTYAAVRHDFDTWRPKLSDRAVVLFHDTNERLADFGVWRFWAEVSAEYPGFEFVHSHGLGVLCVGEAAPAAVLALAELSPRETAAVRGRFARLGERWEVESRALLLARDVAARDGHIGGLTEALRVATVRAGDAARLEAERAALRAEHAVLDERLTELEEPLRVAASLRRENTALRAVRQAELDQAVRATEERFAPVRAQASHAAALAAALAAADRAPIRWFIVRFLRWHGRRIAKAAWWVITPWRMPRRMAEMRARPVIAAPAARAPVIAAPAPSVAPPASDAAGAAYARWIADIEPLQQRQPTPPPAVPGPAEPGIRFSVLIGLTDAPALLERTLASLRAQLDGRWEVLIASLDAPGRSSERPGEREVRRVGIGLASERGAVLQTLLEAASGAWVTVLDAGDVLASDALGVLDGAIAAVGDLAVLYADEDVLSADGRRVAPQFKPDWSPELLTAYNYFGRLTVLSRPLALAAGGFTAGTGAGAEWGLHLRLTAEAEAAGRRITRVSRVLCHRAEVGVDRPVPGSLAADQHRAALAAHWRAGGIAAAVETQPDGTQHSRFAAADTLVSVIIPNHDSPDMLRRCVTGLLERTAHRRLEVIIVENNSTDPRTTALYDELTARGVRVVRHDAPFNYSAACNRGAAVAAGALLLFLNNDIEVVEPGWLGEMVRLAERPGVGIVGAKLRYPDGTLQHAGVAVGIHLYGLMFNRGDEAEWGVFGSPNTTRNWLAIMGACQMVRRAVFDRVGGFDEAYQVANSDVALCLRAHKAGWRTVYTPWATLLHHEGATRGHINPAADMARSAREVARLGLETDPFLHPELSGFFAVPRLRIATEPSLRDVLALDAARHLAGVPAVDPPFDAFDDAAVLARTALPASLAFWPPQPPGRVSDAWSAARWIIDLLRSRRDLRRRFPHALREGGEGSFAAWLDGEGGRSLGLPEAARGAVQEAFAADLSAAPRQLFLWRDDVREAFPLGLLPGSCGDLACWMLGHGVTDEGQRLEAAWWFILCCLEDPAAELVRTYRFSPSWQQAHPIALTVFGRIAFSGWLAERFGLSVDTVWLDPAGWPTGLSAADELRLAYAAEPGWRAAHPAALTDADGAAALLQWLSGSEPGLAEPVRAWCRERLADGTAAALAGLGINVVGHFCYPSGLRVSAEAMCGAMEQAGVAVSRRDVRTDRRDDPHHAEFGGLELHDVTLIHTQAEPFFDTSFARADLGERAPRTYRVAYWYWELESVPAYWAEKARQVDEVWAATAFVADALRGALDRPVHRLFPGVQVGRFTPRRRGAFGLTGAEQGRFTFLFSFHMGSVMERKNPYALIAAFRQAFRTDEPVDLILKTTSFGHEAQVRALREAAEGANIQVLERVTTPDETLSLIDCCDAYVSLHRSEGLGLTMAEAMLLGKPVIATRYSGNLDFMDDANSLLVDYKLVTLGRPVPPYDAAARWAEPSVDHAARLMRRLYDNQGYAAELGAAARRDAERRLSLDAAGRRFTRRLEAIRQQR